MIGMSQEEEDSEETKCSYNITNWLANDRKGTISMNHFAWLCSWKIFGHWLGTFTQATVLNALQIQLLEYFGWGCACHLMLFLIQTSTTTTLNLFKSALLQVSSVYVSFDHQIPTSRPQPTPACYWPAPGLGTRSAKKKKKLHLPTKSWALGCE